MTTDFTKFHKIMRLTHPPVIDIINKKYRLTGGYYSNPPRRVIFWMSGFSKEEGLILGQYCECDRLILIFILEYLTVIGRCVLLCYGRKNKYQVYCDRRDGCKWCGQFLCRIFVLEHMILKRNGDTCKNHYCVDSFKNTKTP